MKILVTGFEPFGGETMNPAYEAVKQLPDTIEGAQIIKLEVPVVFQTGWETILTAIRQENPEAIIAVGQAGGRSGITPELLARNIMNARIADNAGNQPENLRISQNGEKLYRTKLPVKEMLREMRELGIPAHLSFSAGTYVCNDVFYRLMEYLDREAPGTLGGFIHVPFAPEQTIGKKDKPSLPLGVITQALTVAVQETVKALSSSGTAAIALEAATAENDVASALPTTSETGDTNPLKKLTARVWKSYDHLFNYQEIADTLYGYAAEHPELCRVTVAGTTPEGRDILVLEVTDTQTGSYEDKPAYYIEGNIHAGEITGCMSVMFFLDTIFSNLEEDDIQYILDNYTIYAMPRVSPDGSEHYLTTPDYVRSVNRYYPLQEDELKGLIPCDLDGDGVIRKMRVRSSNGIWKEDPLDSRVMVRRRPDEVEGVFYNVYSEGLIQGERSVTLAAAPQGFGNDFNRNYPIGWKPEQEQNGAGSYPLSNPETRANTDFLLSHPNVCSVLDMHTMGGQILYTPGFKSAKEAERADIALYKAIGQMAHEENGFPVINVFDEYMPVGSPACFGGFDDYCHFMLGVPAFTIECWDLHKRAGVKEEFPPKAEESEKEQVDNVRKYLRWIDTENDGEGVKDWTVFQHPQLGEVEIGGVDYKHVIQNPPVKFLPQEVEKHARFMLRQVKTLPRIRFEKTKAEALGGGLYRLETEIVNLGYLSSYVFKEGLKLKTLKPLTVTVTGSQLVEGKKETDIGHLEGFSGIRGYNSIMGPTSNETDPTRKKLSWVIRAEAGEEVTIQVTGGHIGKSETTVVIE